VLVSLMARLSCRTAAEHFLIPAFVFFFDMLFPFGAANDPKASWPQPRAVACWHGAARWRRRAALRRSATISLTIAPGACPEDTRPDLARSHQSRRQPQPYEHLSDIRKMVSRSAYASSAIRRCCCWAHWWGFLSFISRRCWARCSRCIMSSLPLISPGSSWPRCSSPSCAFIACRPCGLGAARHRCLLCRLHA